MDERPYTEIPIGDPLRDAWEAHKKTDDFINSRKWAATANYPHLDGSLWAMFSEGYKAGRGNAFAALAEHLGCKDLNVDLVAMMGALEDAKITMKHARIFIQSRQKMHPDGQKLYGECLTKVRQALPHDTVDRADIGHEE